ncbi:MAG: VOC family protein [Dactylosporangium sp.]|nr:VOC family protein [Dactylosporangium sp.]NNJ60574.1 VOC family protein [Dactylosporangium sp.]
MVERTSYIDGEPCWADIMARDPEAARDFYQKVFGWTYQIGGPESGGYALCLADGKPVAGLMPWQSQMGDIPPHWALYLSTAQTDETAQAITASGGRIMVEPMDVPGSGRMAFGADPAGAAFGVWQPEGHLGFASTGGLGAFAWAELNTRESAAADRFYHGLFGYEQRQIGQGDFDYTVWSLAGKEICGRMLMPPEMGDVPPHWMIYFGVDDTDAAIVRVTEAGGALRYPPHDSPYGRLAGVSDPEGAAFCIVGLTPNTAS